MNLTDKADSWKMFDQIASKYDRLNQILSLGLALRWREKLGKYLPQGKGLKVLDLATGTADVLITLLQNYPQLVQGYGIDRVRPACHDPHRTRLSLVHDAHYQGYIGRS